MARGKFDNGGTRRVGRCFVQFGDGAASSVTGFGGEFGEVEEAANVAGEDGGVGGGEGEELEGDECGEGVSM